MEKDIDRIQTLRYKQFGKGIVKYNAFKQNFTLFCSTSEHKGVSFTLWIFRWRIFDRRDVKGNDKVENDQSPEAANVLYWFEKVRYLLCWKLGRTLLLMGIWWRENKNKLVELKALVDSVGIKSADLEDKFLF